MKKWGKIFFSLIAIIMLLSVGASVVFSFFGNAREYVANLFNTSGERLMSFLGNIGSIVTALFFVMIGFRLLRMPIVGVALIIVGALILVRAGYEMFFANKNAPGNTKLKKE